jgi:hypothetical protein
MTPSTQKIQRVSAITVVCYFVAFTAICWFLDLAFPGKLATQTRYGIFFDAGVITGTVALVCSFMLRRSHPWLARCGFYTILLWLIWAALPRL